MWAMGDTKCVYIKSLAITIQDACLRHGPTWEVTSQEVLASTTTRPLNLHPQHPTLIWQSENKTPNDAHPLPIFF